MTKEDSHILHKAFSLQSDGKEGLSDIMVSNKGELLLFWINRFSFINTRSCRRPSVTNLSHKLTGHVNFDQNNIAMSF